MAGRGSLAGLMPYGDANAIVKEMGSEVLPVVKNTMVLAGVCGAEPFRLMPVLLKELKAMGFDGVQNFPTVGLFDGTIRQGLEETGMGYDLEVKMIAEAHQLDMLTCPYVFTPEDAINMTRAGADILVPHMGLTTKGAIGAKTALTLDDCANKIQAMHDAAKSVRDDVMVICHGGPILTPRCTVYFRSHQGNCRIFWSLSIERLAVEPAIEAQAKRFKEMKSAAISHQLSAVSKTKTES